MEGIKGIIGSTYPVPNSRFNVVSLPDWHVPFHSPKAIEAALQFCKTIQPDVIVLHEMHDFYALSKFDKDPKRITGLQDEIDVVVDYCRQLNEMCPAARKVLLASNHLDRLWKYLWKNAKELSSLKCLEIKELLQLSQLNIEYMDSIILRGYLFKHGDIIRKHAGYTARAEFEKEGMSGMSGHSHRIGEYYVTRRGGRHVWIECGCLCDLNPSYVEGTANWQNGIGLVSFKGTTKHYFATGVPIIDNEILYGVN